MSEIKLQKRYKYAGDIMPKLLDIGFDLETASDFLNSIPDADVAPRAEVAREIFEEIEKYMMDSVDVTHTAYKTIGTSTFAILKKKYTEGQK
jgi:aspartate oxidase